MISNRSKIAFGAPGIVPRWTSGAKEAIGTAYSVASKVWFTVVNGCLSEVYHPTIDTPQIRDLQFLITDGETFFHEERRTLLSEIHPMDEAALGVSATVSDPDGRFQLRKYIVTDPFQNTVLVHTTVDAEEEWLRKLRVYVLCAPHLNIGGYGNTGEVVYLQERTLLTAHKENMHLALTATVPFLKASVGYVGASDGWTDLQQHKKMEWLFDYAPDGNVALMAELDLKANHTFTMALSFGDTRQSAVMAAFQSLSAPFERVRQNVIKQWARTEHRAVVGELEGEHNQHLFATSINLLLAHEDKSYPGALIASMSIPWGERKGDEELGGYHLVWSRDMVQSASALLSVGDLSTPLRSLIYLAVAQLENGSFYQNFWIDGRPYWKGIQLDEVAFPILLAWRLREAGALAHFDPHEMARTAISFILKEGPLTRQDRWEEASGYSPSTLAAVLAGLICGASVMRQRGDDETAEFVEEYADFLNANLERWTVTTDGVLDPKIKRHFIRVNPVPLDADGYHDEDPNRGTLRLANQEPGTQFDYPAREIVDGGFLELVRYGIRRAGDPLFEDSLKVADRVLKVETPQGPCWRRYNHDGYGQRNDGSGYEGWGVGRAWPLLIGERAHYELAAGRNPLPLLKAYEAFANGAGLLPEQVWDVAESPNENCKLGAATGAAIPLAWAHAEYVKLVRSISAGYPVDRVAPVYERYVVQAAPPTKIDVWAKNRKVRTVRLGTKLRFIFDTEFFVRWTDDDWEHQQDLYCSRNALDLHYADVPVLKEKDIKFTIFWRATETWEGRDYCVTPVTVANSEVAQAASTQSR